MSVSRYNIPRDVLDVCWAAGMRPVATGGGIDYMEHRIGGLGVRIVDVDDAGSPDSADVPCALLIAPVRDEYIDAAEGIVLHLPDGARTVSAVLNRMKPL